MEPNQSSTNQNLTGSEVHPQQTGSDQELFVAVVISVLLTAMLTGSAIYFWQKSASEKVVSSLEQKISSLENQISTIKNSKVMPQPTSSPSLSPTSTQPNQKTTLQPVDSQSPSNISISGVSEGGIISTTLPFGPFCVKSLGYDDLTETNKLLMRNKLNNENWSGWSLDYERCWKHLEDGEYTYSLQVKDEAGNISNVFSRNFTVKNID